MQYYKRIYDYAREYFQTIYTVYARHGTAFQITYYKINQDETIWDNEKMMNGPYEWVGDLSGVRFDKILYLPIYWITEINNVFEAQDIGLVNEDDFDFVMPSEYKIDPIEGELIKLDQTVIDTTNDDYPLYKLSGKKKQTHQDLCYWQCHANVFQSTTETEVEKQVVNTYAFYDYTKKIYMLDDTISMTNLLSKNDTIRQRLNNLYDRNSGYYFI